MIMAQSLALKLKIAEQKRPLMIPYHSIGGDGGLPAYRIPLLILQDGSVIRNIPCGGAARNCQKDTLPFSLLCMEEGK